MVAEFEDVLDIYMAEYSLTLDQVISHTYYQLRYLSRAMLKRIGMRDQKLMNMYRVSQHGKRSQYERYYNSLVPVFEDENKAGKLILPNKGLSYSKK